MVADPSSYEVAAERFRELGLPFWLGVKLLEHGDLTGDASLLSEAREIFGRLEARPWPTDSQRLPPSEASQRAEDSTGERRPARAGKCLFACSRALRPGALSHRARRIARLPVDGAHPNSSRCTIAVHSSST
jgi:hypothetical protein